jgi:hypothetical protein
MIDPHTDRSLPSEPATSNRAAWIVGEPAMPDLLDDPLIHAVLRRDGLSLADLQSAITQARRRLAAPARRRETPASDAA